MDYAPIAIMFLVAAGFGASQLLVTQLIGPRKRTATKLMPYECGQRPGRLGSRSFLDQVLYGCRYLPTVRYRSAFHDPVRRRLQELDRGRSVSRRGLRHDRFCRDLGFRRDADRRIHLRLEERDVRLGRCRPVRKLEPKQRKWLNSDAKPSLKNAA